MKKDGLQRNPWSFSISFSEKGIEFEIMQEAPSSLTVKFGLVGVRVEADFDLDMMHFSVFKGSEAVETDEKILHDLIKRHWDEVGIRWALRRTRDRQSHLPHPQRKARRRRAAQARQ